MTLQSWQLLMIKRLFSYSWSRARIELGFQIKDENIPTKFYKYRNFQDDFHINSLKNDTQWFSAPCNFNDPLDSSAIFKIDMLMVEQLTLEQMALEIDRILHKEASGSDYIPSPIKNPVKSGEWFKAVSEPLLNLLTMPQREALLDILRSHNSTVNRDMISQFSESLRNGLSILSLSTTPLSMLMWSHYANKHSGFCIEYDFSILPKMHPMRRMCFPVFYRKKRTDISRFLSAPRHEFNIMLGTYVCLVKNSVWEYEREWRIVYPIGGEGVNRTYAMPVPSALIVGSSVSAPDLAFAKSFAAKRGIPLRRAELDLGKGELSIKDC